MAARLSRFLTAATVFFLVALLLIMIVDGLTPVNLDRWSNAVVWALAVLILIRLMTRAGSWRSKIAGPVAGSASVQSRMFGFIPGSSTIAQSSGPTYTTSLLEGDENRRRSPEGDSH